MKYKNAKDVLPPELLTELQKYASGETLYVPKSCDRVTWGQLSGTREQLKLRNIDIFKCYKNGATIDDLIEQFCLSEDSIKKIVYNSKTQALVEC